METQLIYQVESDSWLRFKNEGAEPQGPLLAGLNYLRQAGDGVKYTTLSI